VLRSRVPRSLNPLRDLSHITLSSPVLVSLHQ